MQTYSYKNITQFIFQISSNNSRFLKNPEKIITAHLPILHFSVLQGLFAFQFV